DPVRDRGPAGSASPGSGSPRRQALQLFSGSGWTREGWRLRPGEISGARRPSDQDRRVRGHAAFRLARTGAWRDYRSANRCLLRGGHTLLSSNRTAALLGHGYGGDVGTHRLGPAAALAELAPGPVARTG